jgi:hypothetical protein
MGECNGNTELIRRQVQLILDSPGFAGSHRLSDFLRFVCDAALNGRQEVDQIEIASAVLGRAEGFNPVEDASVRKLATAARQRLDQYYSTTGKLDPVILQLPQRSYLPRFRLRDGSAAGFDQPAENGTSAGRRRLGLRIGVAALLLGAIGLAAYGWYHRAGTQTAPGRFTIVARKGNINLGRKDAPPQSLLLGATVRTTDQVIARMVFSPKAESDQAGILIYDDVDNYVKFGRILQRYNNLHFTTEIRDIQRTGPNTYTVDPEGQTGAPVWLAIRRNGDEFRAFVSPDGRAWRRTGEAVHAQLSAAKARFAIYAFREIDSHDPPVATFDHLSAGPAVASWGDEVPALSGLDGWSEVNECKSEVTATPQPNLLTIAFADGASRCRWHLLSTAPAGDWSLGTVIDNVGWARTFAGVIVKGSRRTLYLLRNALDGGSLIGTTNQERLFARPDFPGSPPIVLRVFCHQGIVRAEAGTDWDTLAALPLHFDIRELGSGVRIGPTGGRGQLQGDLPLAPIGFRFAGMEVLSLAPYR